MKGLLKKIGVFIGAFVLMFSLLAEDLDDFGWAKPENVDTYGCRRQGMGMGMGMNNNTNFQRRRGRMGSRMNNAMGKMVGFNNFNFEDFDKNSDGKIDKNEFNIIKIVFQRLKSGYTFIGNYCNKMLGRSNNTSYGNKNNNRGYFMKQYILKKYDVNKNGKLDDNEKQKLYEDKSRLFKKHDKDKNGVLSPEERDALLKEVRELLGIKIN